MIRKVTRPIIPSPDTSPIVFNQNKVIPQVEATVMKGAKINEVSASSKKSHHTTVIGQLTPQLSSNLLASGDGKINITEIVKSNDSGAVPVYIKNFDNIPSYLRSPLISAKDEISRASIDAKPTNLVNEKPSNIDMTLKDEKSGISFY